MIKKAPNVLSVPGLELEASARVRPRGRNPVLVALDGTSDAERTIPWAVNLAQRWHAPLRLVHVRNPVEDAHKMDLCLIDNGKSLSVQSRAGAYLETLAESVGDSSGVAVGCETVTGVVIADTLRLMCERNAPRVLVMARPRRSNLSRFVLGSVTDRLMGNLAVPLLLVPDESRAASQDVTNSGGWNRMLVHLDGTEASERVVDLVISIASKDTLCHLRRVVPLASLYSKRSGEFSHNSDVRGEAWQELSRARERLERNGIRCTSRLIFDDHNVASAIVAQAKAMQALVVVAAPRKHLMPWWLRNDVAEDVVRQADVPVLVVSRYGNGTPPAVANHVDNHSNEGGPL